MKNIDEKRKISILNVKSIKEEIYLLQEGEKDNKKVIVVRVTRSESTEF